MPAFASLFGYLQIDFLVNNVLKENMHQRSELSGLFNEKFLSK